MRRRHFFVFSALTSLVAAACGGSSDDNSASSSAASSGSGGASTSSSSSKSASSASSSSSSGAGGETVDEIMQSLPSSCVFDCTGSCDEAKTPFSCPTLADWKSLPHDDACGNWDGTYPKPQQGKCTVSAPSGESVKKSGVDPANPAVQVLPDGHRISPAGAEWVFQEPDLEGTYPMSLFAVPGTTFVLNSDGGIEDNTLRVIDTSLIGATDPVVSYAPFHANMKASSLYFGVAFVAPGEVYASGGGDGMIYAFTLDTTTGALARDDAHDIPLPTTSKGMPFYSSAIAVTADGSKMFVAPSEGDATLLAISLDPATYGQVLKTIGVGSNTVFDVQRDPFDATGDAMVVSDEGKGELYLVDGAAMKVTGKVALDKNPAQLAFLDATYLAVAESDSDKIAIVDRVALSVVARVPAFEDNAPRGYSPTTLAYDATSKTLYSTLAGINAVEAYSVDTSASPPSLTPIGHLPTSWWPTALLVDADGSVVVTNGKGRGEGTDDMQYTWGQEPITHRMRGSVQKIPAPSPADLTAGTATVTANLQIASFGDAPQITCPNGADDFPVPATNTAGPSKLIKHVILIVRENKTYDGVMGDRKDLGDGDASLIMAPTPQLESAIWKNTRDVAAAFTNFDNFYTDAEQSIQGHEWTVFGRTNDYLERSWLTIWGRGTRNEADAINSEATPEEGGVFSWLAANKVTVQDFGEIVGGGALDLHYPGLAFTLTTPDNERACYIGGHMRLLCDLPQMTYAILPCDHTNGGAANSPAPEVMIADNDEGTGMVLDALSHSPMWKDTLLIVTEDDPQDGGDHVDLHRSILFMASPWVKRGYVSHGHYDMGSVYKLVANIFGIPYNNEMERWAEAPLDAFTSTPDYTPYTYSPRTVDAKCNASNTKEAAEAENWDFDDPDDQPGLSQQLARMMKESSEQRGVKIVK